MPIHLLSDAARWSTASHAERLGVALELVARLGDRWALEEPADGHSSALLLHRPTDVRFVPVCGGTFRMGLLDEELALIDRYVGSRPHVLEQVHGVRRYARPVRQLRVEPFLCAVTLLEKSDVVRLWPEALPDDEGALRRPDALSLCERAGFRLPSDAELEWIARQGTEAPFVLGVVFEAAPDDEENVLITNQPVKARFGISDLFTTQWAADDWFEDHEDRPGSAVARTGGEPEGVRRFEEFYFKAVGPESVISQLSARRDAGSGWEARVRFALDLPPR